MSIMRTAVRLAAVQALKGATIAGASVHDSRIVEVDLAAIEDRHPFLTVTTDDQEGEVDGRDILTSDATLDLVIEMAIAQAVLAEDGTVAADIPDTDAGYELTLDLMCRQVVKVLQYGGGDWGDLFRELVPSFTNMVQRRGADARKGVRFAARQIILTVRTLADPLGVPEAGLPLARFFAMAAAVPTLANHRAVMLAELGEDEPAELWELIQRQNGWTNATAAAFGLVEDPGDATGTAVPGVTIAGYVPPAGEGSGALEPEPDPED